MHRQRQMKLTPELVALVHRTIPDTGPSPGFVLLDEADYDRITAEVLQSHSPTDDLWIFAYGSLMWRPACEIDGQEMARLNGWHRKFCIRIARYRGTPDNPGLMMALDRGGSCRAVVQRLPAKSARERLGQLMRRAASVMVSCAACARASAWVAQWLRTRKASRVRSGRLSQMRTHSNGPESAMHARMRFSKAAARGA